MPSRRDRLVILITTLGSLILLNVIARDHFFRIDLTRDAQFTLAKATVATMESLEDPVQVTAYFSADLPPQFASQERYVRDLLEEFHAASDGMLSFEFVDPLADEDEADQETRKDVRRDIFGRAVRQKTQKEQELEAMGIQPVEIRVIEEDAQQTRRGYLGIVIRYREETEVIPVVQGTTGIEYDLVSMIRRLVRARIPVVGVAQIHGEANAQEELGQVARVLAQDYELRPLTTLDELDDGIDALLIVGNTEPYDPAEQKRIDQFLMKGGRAAFLLDLARVDPERFAPEPIDNGFGPLLSTYGVGIGSQYVADAECATLSIAQRRGFMIVSVPVQYPLIPQLRFPESDSPLTRGLTDTMVPFAAPLHPSQVEGVEWHVLASSSRQSWLEPPNPQAVNPQRDWAAETIRASGPYDLIALGSGLLPSHFAADGEAGASTAEGLLTQGVEEARIVVAGTSNLARDPFMAAGNAALVQNLVDWMLLDPQMLEMRTRRLAVVPLDPELSDTARNAVKYGNVVGLPLLLALYGFVRRLGRERRRAALRGSA